ncbi:MAG: hypothetical protein DWP95_04350 [Proteobacteria bacterium]|nr:MAG: hypothetical protein DWP95_04350 [Pseudomonadota bacterium]
MSKIKEIEQAVKNFTEEELRLFRRWFASYDGKAWDTQLESDVQLGKLDDLANSAIDAHQKGQSKEF